MACVEPGLTVAKGYEHDDADGDGELSVGEVITYSFTVTNTGNVTITDIAVTDELPGLSPVACTATELAPADEPMVCTATYVVTQGDIDAGGIANVASVTGIPPAGPPVEAPSNEVVIEGPERSPDLTLVKTVAHHDRDGDGRVAAGERLTYSFEVTNTGNVTLTAVTVDDPMPGLSAVACPGDVLAPGEAMTCTATYTVTPADEAVGWIVNTATARADGPPGVLGQVVSAPSTVTTDVAGPAPSGSLPRTGGPASELALAGLALVLVGWAVTRRQRDVVGR